jgi:hypothetical protein
MRAPAVLVPVMLLKAGSGYWVNHSVTSCGGLATLLPTRGSARSEKACAGLTGCEQEQQGDDRNQG